MIDFLREAAQVVPSKRQLMWYDTAFYAFIHFGMNTFTDREWGDGTEPESLFDPTQLDCSQWASVLRDAGIRGMILTAKHHDGFCLWPSQYTEHSVKNAACKRDVVGEAASACRAAGLRFGVYLSPWDRNCACYGTPEYNDFYCAQLKELLTGYGELFCVWFDGACGEGPDGKSQEYDFPRYIELIRKYQPNARDAARLMELRRLIDQEFANPLAVTVEQQKDGYPTQPVSKVKYVELREEIEKGQRIETFRIEAVFHEGKNYPLYQGTTVGNRKICVITDPFAEQNRLLDGSGDKTDKLLVKVTAARGEVSLKQIVVYGE